MKIAIPVAAFHEYNTALYVAKAFWKLGHKADIVTQAELYELTSPKVDLVFGVDSAGPLDFPDRLAQKTAMWYIDSRHNCDPDRRNPPDDVAARLLAERGGWVFQAQKRDWENFVQKGILRSSWLPLAADVDVWEPVEAPELNQVGFYGNIWCEERRRILDMLRAEYGSKFVHVVGQPRECVEAMATCQVLFNVSGWFENRAGIDYDINMRVFEGMSMGRPLVTNYLPELTELGFQPAFHLMTYTSVDTILPVVRTTLAMSEELKQQIGKQARQFISEGHTYVKRMEEALEILKDAEVV